MQFFMHINGQQLGPFDESELLMNGLTPTTPVWSAGMPSWQPANQVAALAYLFVGQTPPAFGGQPQYGQPQYGQAQYNYYQQPQPQYGYQQPSAQNNTMGVAGFVCSLLFWTPYCGFVFWILGLVFSIIGLQKEPKGLAKAGLVISIVSLVLLILLVVVGFAAFGMALGGLSSLH